MLMSIAARIEFRAGIVTGVLTVVSSGFFIIASKSSEVLVGSLPYVGLGILVAFGSYLHVKRGRILGLVIVLLSGLILTAMGLVGGAIYHARGLWIGLPLVLPCVTAAIAVVAAIVAAKGRQSSA